MEAQGIQLTEQRARIDAIDERILRWLNRRVEAGAAIGQIKKDIGIGSVDEEREAGVLKRLRAITFEFQETYYERLGVDGLVGELNRMHELAACCGTEASTAHAG